MELIETRSMSGRGILKVPDENKTWRRFHLRANVLRLPISQRVDRDYNPEKSFFATLTFIREGDIIDYKNLEFINQMWDFYPPYDGQAQIALKCAYQGILQTFFNLGNALALPSISLENAIKGYTELTNIWDEVRVVCFSSSAIELNLYAEDYQTCDEDFPQPAPPPEKPPTPPPAPLPPTTTPPEGEPPNAPYATPIGDLSPPYDGEDDGGNTVPWSTDDNPVPPPPTQGDPCSLYDVGLSWKVRVLAVEDPGSTVTKTIRVFGVVGQVSTAILSSGSPTNLYIECQGIKDNGQTGAPQTQTCSTFGVYLIGNTGYNSNDVETFDFKITSVESA